MGVKYSPLGVHQNLICTNCIHSKYNAEQVLKNTTVHHDGLNIMDLLSIEDFSIEYCYMSVTWQFLILYKVTSDIIQRNFRYSTR